MVIFAIITYVLTSEHHLKSYVIICGVKVKTAKSCYGIIIWPETLIFLTSRVISGFHFLEIQKLTEIVVK